MSLESEVKKLTIAINSLVEVMKTPQGELTVTEQEADKNAEEAREEIAKKKTAKKSKVSKKDAMLDESEEEGKDTLLDDTADDEDQADIEASTVLHLAKEKMAEGLETAKVKKQTKKLGADKIANLDANGLQEMKKWLDKQ
jgi:hypothetical protein